MASWLEPPAHKPSRHKSLAVSYWSHLLRGAARSLHLEKEQVHKDTNVSTLKIYVYIYIHIHTYTQAHTHRVKHHSRNIISPSSSTSVPDPTACPGRTPTGHCRYLPELTGLMLIPRKTQREQALPQSFLSTHGMPVGMLQWQCCQGRTTYSDP